jgi:kinesin family protein 11
MSFLHRTISTSVSQQESQLKVLEEEMQSFITSKSKVCQHKIMSLQVYYISRLLEVLEEEMQST